MALLAGIPPILPRRPRLLILGSMPSVRSLSAVQYYAHPQNAFWPLLFAVLGLPLPPDYAARVTAAKKQGIAIWDVLAQCRRAGSADTAIEKSSECANDIAGLLRRSPSVQAVALNGGRARECFRRHQCLDGASLPVLSLPSTSPANAGMTFRRKCDMWESILPFCIAEDEGAGKKTSKREIKQS